MVSAICPAQLLTQLIEDAMGLAVTNGPAKQPSSRGDEER
jgi:hypothetical protein